MRQASLKETSNEGRSESKNAMGQNGGGPAAKRGGSGAGGGFQRQDSRFLYISYRDLNGKLRQESTKSESRKVAENLLRDRLGQVERGLVAGEMKKLKYEDIRALLIVDYRTPKLKLLEHHKDRSPHPC